MKIFGFDIRRAVEPKRAAPRRGGVAAHVPVFSPAGNYYEGLKASADRGILPTGLPILRDSYQFGSTRLQFSGLSRYLYENTGMVSYAVSLLVNSAVPCGVVSAAPDTEAGNELEEYFMRWAGRADASGRFDYWTLQRMAVIASILDGDVGVMANKSAGFAQVELVESWRIGAPGAAGPGMVDGVKVDKDGRVIGYQLTDGQKATGEATAAEMLLLYEPDFYSDYRGKSPMRRSTNDVRDAQEIKTFGRLKEKIYSSLAGYIKNGPLENVGDTWNETDAEPGEEPPATNLSLWEMLGGEIPALPPGQEFVPIATPQGGERTIEWIASLAAHFVMSLGIPPAYFLDEKLTGPNQRSVNKKAQRRFRQSQQMVARMDEWVWLRVIGDAIDRGELKPVPGWDRVEHTFPEEVSIDAGQDESNDRENALKGLSSLKSYHRRRAGDWQREKRQMFEEDEATISQAKAIADRHGVPVEVILARHGYAAATPSQPKPEGGNRPKEDDEETPKNDSDDEP